MFTRDETKGPNKTDIYEFRQAIKRPMDVAANTSRKTLFVSRASQMDRDIAKKVFRFFTEDIVLDYKESAMPVEDFLKTKKEYNPFLDYPLFRDCSKINVNFLWSYN